MLGQFSSLLPDALQKRVVALLPARAPAPVPGDDAPEGRPGLARLAVRLIAFADMVEAGLATALRLCRRMLGRRGLGLTGGLVWRGLAAVTGIGLSAALVTGLSAAGDEVTLASLTLPATQDGRPVRDVRQEPRPSRLAAEDWVKVIKPIAMFGLESPELDRQAPVYESRRSQDGTRREDTLTFGGFTEPQRPSAAAAVARSRARPALATLRHRASCAMLPRAACRSSAAAPWCRSRRRFGRSRPLMRR